MKKIFISSWLILLSAYCFAQYRNDSVTWNHLIDTANFKLIYKKSNIDSDILKLLPELKKMANPDKGFNATDNIGRRLPNRRLLFAANYDKYWIICYEHGGRGYHQHCFFIEKMGNVPFYVLHNYFYKIAAFEDLKEVLKRNNFIVEDWHIGDEY